MHPLVAQYLSVEAAVQTLEKADRGERLEDAERRFAESVGRDPRWREQLKGAKGQKSPSPEVQRILLVAAARAAAGALGEEPKLREPIALARAALVEHGATGEDVEHFLGSLVLEEALAYEGSPDALDADFLAETLRTVPALAALDEARVQELLAAFERSAEAEWRAAHRAAARAVVGAAWAEGPEPINPEHVSDALLALSAELGEAEAVKGIESAGRFLEHLAREGLVGPERLRRLKEGVSRAALELGPEEPG